MKLREDDWSGSTIRTIEVDYPDEPIAEFLNWLRSSKTWRAAPDLVEHRLRRLNDTLAEHRVRQKAASAKDSKNKARTEKARLALAAKRQLAAV